MDSPCLHIYSTTTQDGANEIVLNGKRELSCLGVICVVALSVRRNSSRHLDLLELINIPPSSGTINLDLEEAHYNLIVQMFHINII